jgi:hypothetical protein
MFFGSSAISRNLTLQLFSFTDCGSNVSGAESGVISSPNFPLNYDSPVRGLASKTCNWYIIVRPKHKILLNFEFFAVEGEPSGRFSQI